MSSEVVVKPSSDRLIDTVQTLWESAGSAGMSVRRISDESGVPVSSIYHHFGSLEHLFVVAQKAAQAQARHWCDEQLRQLADFPGQRAAIAGFFVQMVDGWVCDQRRLAFCWREGQLLADTGESFQRVASEWDALWSRFWQEAGAMFALGSDAIVAERVFENESLMHMLRWRRIVDRAGLDELGHGLAAWLTGAPMPASPWRDFAREQAVRSVPQLPVRDEVTTAIIGAAGDLISSGGVAALTHRAVAEHAGLTLGVVLHRFKTKAQLVEAAFEALYLSMVDGMQDHAPAPDAPLPVADLDEMTGMIGRSAGRMGNKEIFLVAMRTPSLNRFGAQIRYLRGRKSRGTVQAIAGPAREVGQLEAALFSSFASSLTRAHADARSRTTPDSIRRELQLLAELIGRRR